MHLKDHLILHIVLADNLQKTKKEYKNLKKQEIHEIFLKTKLDKACFQHDKAYEGFKDLTRRTYFDKILRDKAFNIVKYLKYDRYQRGLASMFYKFFDKKTSGSCITNENISKKN